MKDTTDTKVPETPAVPAPIGSAAATWQAISSAPVSGKAILLWWKNCGDPSVGRWTHDETGDGWRCDGDQCVPRNQKDCTHWMPLLEPPSDRAGLPPLPAPAGTGRRTAEELLREVMAWHSDPESTDYNECEKAPCAWCSDATAAITRKNGQAQKVRAGGRLLVEAAGKIRRLRKAINETLAENGHLADGDVALTENEIKHISSCPSGLSVVMDYHDLQMTLGEPMGFDCSANQKRYDELKVERDRIRKEWESC